MNIVYLLSSKHLASKTILNNAVFSLYPIPITTVQVHPSHLAIKIHFTVKETL